MILVMILNQEKFQTSNFAEKYNMVKYKLYLIHENMEDDKVVGVKEGEDVRSFISKHDTILNDNLGSIEISGDVEYLRDFLELDWDYQEERF